MININLPSDATEDMVGASSVLATFDSILPCDQGIGLSMVNNAKADMVIALTALELAESSVTLGFYLRLPEFGNTITEYAGPNTGLNSPPRVQYYYDAAPDPDIEYGAEGFCLFCLGAGNHKPCLRLLRRTDKDTEVGGEAWQWYVSYAGGLGTDVNDNAYYTVIPGTQTVTGLREAPRHMIDNGEIKIYPPLSRESDEGHFFVAGQSHWIEAQIFHYYDAAGPGFNTIVIQIKQNGVTVMYSPIPISPGPEVPWPLSEAVFGLRRRFTDKPNITVNDYWGRVMVAPGELVDLNQYICPSPLGVSSIVGSGDAFGSGMIG